MKILHHINVTVAIGVLGLLTIGFILLGASNFGIPTHDIEDVMFVIGVMLLMLLGVIQVVFAIYMKITYSDQLDAITTKHLIYYRNIVLIFAISVVVFMYLTEETPLGDHFIGVLILCSIYGTPFLLAAYFVYITRSATKAIG